MQRLVFEVGGHLVRLSANICQLHRPNTIPIFCAAVCRDYRLRTFIAIAFKLVLLQLLFVDRNDLLHSLLSRSADGGSLFYAGLHADCFIDVLLEDRRNLFVLFK